MRKSVLIAVLIAFLVGYGLGQFNSVTMYLPITKVQTNNNERFLEELPVDSYNAKVNVVAVKVSGEEGVLGEAFVEIIEGKGRVLFAINPFVEPDTQYSAETAAEVAQHVTGKSLRNVDVIYTIKTADAKLVGGPSAGAALAIATIAAIQKKQVREDTAITGTINVDGTIGQIGGVIEKAIAVAKAGKKTFLVPKGQSSITYYERVVKKEQMSFITIERINYVPKKLDLNDYLKEQGFKLKVVEVSNIEEAEKYMIV